MPNSPPKNILIIDDSKDMQSLLTHVFESKGHTVACSPDGQHALSCLNVKALTPDLIFLDLMMPVMCGNEFLKHRANDSRLKEIPVIVMSGVNEMQSPIIETPLTFTLKKPFSLTDVLAAAQRDY
jgi:CheY-like chemotaxis protein